MSSALEAAPQAPQPAISQANQNTLAHIMAPGYSALDSTGAGAAAAAADGATNVVSCDMLGPVNVFTEEKSDIYALAARGSDDLSETFFRAHDSKYFANLPVHKARIEEISKQTKPGEKPAAPRINISFAAGKMPFETLVRGPVLTVQPWAMYPLGNNKRYNPDNKYAAEIGKIHDARYNLTFSARATCDMTSDEEGRDVHGVRFFNWLNRLTKHVHATICKDMPQVVQSAAKIKLGLEIARLEAIHQGAKYDMPTVEQFEAEFRTSGFTSPIHMRRDAETFCSIPGTESINCGGKVFMQISPKMQEMYKKKPPVMPPRDESTDPGYDAWPAAVINMLYEQQFEMEIDIVTKKPVVPTKYKIGYKFNDVPLIQVKGASGRSEIVPFWKRKASLTMQSLVSPVFAIGFSISDKTGQLVLNLSINMMHYVGENTPLRSGDSVEDVLKYDVSAIAYHTIPAACLPAASNVPRIEDVTVGQQQQQQLQITAAAPSDAQKRAAAGAPDAVQPAAKRANASQ